MSQSLSKFYAHLVFSTKHRIPNISEALRPRLFAYTAGVLNNLGRVPIEISGVADHIHVLMLQTKNLAPAKLV